MEKGSRSVPLARPEPGADQAPPARSSAAGNGGDQPSGKSPTVTHRNGPRPGTSERDDTKVTPQPVINGRPARPLRPPAPAYDPDDTRTAPMPAIKVNPAQANPAQANPAQANPGQANPGQANPAQGKPGQANSGQANPAPSAPAAKPASPPAQDLPRRTPGAGPTPATERTPRTSATPPAAPPTSPASRPPATPPASGPPSGPDVFQSRPGAFTLAPDPDSAILDTGPIRYGEHDMVPGQWLPAGGKVKPSRSASDEPSWTTVLANTVTLWFRRRTRRTTTTTTTEHPASRLAASQARAGRWRRLRLLTLALVVVLAAVVGVVLAKDNTKSPGPRTSTNPVLTAQAARTQVADWIAAQVSHNTIVSCDPVMCSLLQSHGFPASNLDQLGPSAPDPLDSNLVMATNVLRSQFGARLTSVYAPVVLASFGTGAAAVQVRVVAPDGAPAYLSQLSSDLSARKSFGSQLLRNRNIVVSPSATRQLELGQVDSRLLTVIGTLGTSHRFSIVSFGGAAPGASADVPLRSAILTSRTSGSTAASLVESLRSFLIGQQPPYLPATAQIVRLSTGQKALNIQFAAPYPLGLLGSAHSAAKLPAAG
jgi:hypothetical protein